MKSHTIEFTRDDLVVRITRYPVGRRTGEIAVGRDRGRILRIAPVVRMVRQGAAVVRLQRDARRIYRDVPADERRRWRFMKPER